MADEQRSLRSAFEDAEAKRNTIESSFDSNSSTFQDNLVSAIKLYEECVKIVGQISLFSPNETLEDISSIDLEYLLLNYRIAELLLRINSRDERKANISRAQRSYEYFLKQLDNYDMLAKPDAQLLEQYLDSPATFSAASTTGPASRRDTKIKRFKEEKALRQKLDYLRQNPLALQNDDDANRELQLTSIAFATHQTFAALESIAQELHILSMAPSPQSPSAQPRIDDGRERNGRNDTYSERLDAPPSHMSAGIKAPLLDKSGKPLRPFTLTGKRREFREGVFRPDHSLPTMSIDEYLEEERKRGGMIEGGGAQSQVTQVVDEDDLDAADAATMKARDWDEFVEANPKGSGNTINRG